IVALAASRRGSAAVLACILALSVSVRADERVEAVPSLRPGGSSLNSPDAPLAVRLRAEVGSLGVIAHHIRYGAGGTRIDYRDDGNQDTLFFFWRLSGELRIHRRHTLILLYQPFDLETESVPERALQVGDVSFP